MRGEVNESNQSKRSNCSGSYMSQTLGMDGMDRIVQGVIRVKRLEWIE